MNVKDSLRPIPQAYACGHVRFNWVGRGISKAFPVKRNFRILVLVVVFLFFCYCNKYSEGEVKASLPSINAEGIHSRMQYQTQSHSERCILFLHTCLPGSRFHHR